ncbi:polyamine deacetylase HDAC10 isoform X3 [Elephas maximus indicus]|uniref:polyamine deacetylase HDAC10 isoform X3 n=1 Tax=Elephas maximus indicus TaxID=99487 RepID=UPI002117175E|nr:polyamine deacetylase HDAC10 isoform X3 [Elephas maximus indicus]
MGSPHARRPSPLVGGPEGSDAPKSQARGRGETSAGAKGASGAEPGRTACSGFGAGLGAGRVLDPGHREPEAPPWEPPPPVPAPFPSLLWGPRGGGAVGRLGPLSAAWVLCPPSGLCPQRVSGVALSPGHQCGNGQCSHLRGGGRLGSVPRRVAPSDHNRAMGTALVYHEDMTVARLLWDDPECEMECPERLTVALEQLRRRGLEQRCLRLAAREASEAELGLVHSPEYVAMVRGTQGLGKGELQALSGQYDTVYFHPSTFHCARLAAGATLQLVDAVLTGAAHNGLALVRPPGHHSQRTAANGFCVFNNVAIAAEYAKQKHGLHRILIVDWDVHHGQGTQYIFEDDPSVLYFSWHRYEHGRFWPYLRESDADEVGRGHGRGFTVNLPWNQVGMGNADYVAAFLHVLLPLAFEFDPELVLISAGFDSVIGDPEGGYHLELLAESVCMTVQALLGDPAPPLLGAMVPCGSALESIQRVRAAHAPHWTSLQHQDMAPVLSPSIGSPEARPPPRPPAGAEYMVAAATEAVEALRALLDQLRLRPLPPVRTAIALTSTDVALVLPPGVLHQEGSAPREETEAWARPHEALVRDEALTALGKVLNLMDGILGGQVSSGIAATPALATAATLDVAIRRGLYLGAQRLLCVAVGQLQRPPHLSDDGRILWLDIGGPEAAALSMFHVSVPLPGATGGLLNCVLGLVLPLAYGFQPDVVLVALGPAPGLHDSHSALLASMLRGPAGGRVLALVQESKPQLTGALARALHGEAPPSLGPCSAASPKDTQALKHLREQLEPKWRMLQVAVTSPGSLQSAEGELFAPQN